MNSITEIFTFLKDILNDSAERDNYKTYNFLENLYRVYISYLYYYKISLFWNASTFITNARTHFKNV